MQQCDVVCNRVTRLQHIRELSRFCKGRAASGLHAIQGKQTPGVRFAVRLSPDNKSLQCRHCRSAPDTDRLRGNHRALSPKDKGRGIQTQWSLHTDAAPPSTPVCRGQFPQARAPQLIHSCTRTASNLPILAKVNVEVLVRGKLKEEYNMYTSPHFPDF